MSLFSGLCFNNFAHYSKYGKEIKKFNEYDRFSFSFFSGTFYQFKLYIYKVVSAMEFKQILLKQHYIRVRIAALPCVFKYYWNSRAATRF